jgi:hypothetical protein
MITRGIIVGNRVFFPAHLCSSGRQSVPNFQKLLQSLQPICRNGFEQHVAATKAAVADAVEDARSSDLGWATYYHQS